MTAVATTAPTGRRRAGLLGVVRNLNTGRKLAAFGVVEILMVLVGVLGLV